jgi:hypothetical protein
MAYQHERLKLVPDTNRGMMDSIAADELCIQCIDAFLSIFQNPTG